VKFSPQKFKLLNEILKYDLYYFYFSLEFLMEETPNPPPPG
jgi:hypothetical protein